MKKLLIILTIIALLGGAITAGVILLVRQNWQPEPAAPPTTLSMEESIRAAEEAAAEVSRQAEAESHRQAEEAEITEKLQKLVNEAQQGAALGSLFSLGTMETSIGAAKKDADGYRLNYIYQYTYDVVDTASVVQNLESTVNLQSAMFQGTLNRMQQEGIPNPSVYVQYRNRDGGLIYEREFK